MITASQMLREAADHIEAVGLNQDGHYYAADLDAGPEVRRARPCCMIGALRIVRTNHDTPTLTVEQDDEIVLASSISRNALATEIDPMRTKYPHDVIVHWNDDPKTTKEDVLKMLRTTADKLEEEDK